MPLYDYLCTACDHRADILLGINDPGPRYCLSCGAEGTMRKQFAVPSIHFKGSGWAKKDRGSSTSTKAAAKAASGEVEGASASPTTSPSTTEAASPSSDTSKPSTTD